jgi:putative membrane protein
MKFLFRTLITAGALMIVAYVVPGIEVTGWVPAIVASVFLIIFNVLVRPILIILTLPVTIMTLGLFIFVINASMLLFVASFVEGIHIASFWSALFGSLLLSVIGAFANKNT